jgi:flagellar basal body rod protein FlgC
MKQGAVEMSGVDAIKSMIDVSSASSAVSGALSLVTMFNEMMGRAITSLGRVS